MLLLSHILMRYVAFATYEHQYSTVSFESLVSEFDDLIIIYSKKNVLWNGLYLLDCPEIIINMVKDKVYPYFLIMEDF